ncbi:MAG: alpha/beta hydrolase [Deltaproteobacteria bacterium]|nr:alpha/beta hydrolase [Deltaproteobacteria bacterium]
MASAELQMVIDLLKAGPIPRDQSFAAQREGLDNLSAMAPPPADASYEEVTFAGRPAAWIQAGDASPARTLLYLHGGGYCVGSLKSHRGLATDLSRAAGVRVLLLDYRLAPEHPFPAAVDDALAAYRALLAQDVEARHIAIAGDSAGGGLTAATLLALRDAGLPRPAAGVLLSPWLDLTLSGESMDGRAAIDPMVQREPLQRMADAYLAGADPRAPLASPLFADLHGLPPLLIQVGSAETLLDDSTRFAARARAADVSVRLDVWDDMIHVFNAFAFLLPEARTANQQIGAFLRERLA